VIGDGLVHRRGPTTRRLADRNGRTSEVRLLVLLMVVVCGLSATMSSTAVTAIFIPVATPSTGIAASRLMMPLSFAALISGMTTLVATAPNLVVNSELERHGVPGFHFFSFTPFGLPILVLGILYMLFARRWLAVTNDAKAGASGRPSLADWIEKYKLANREYRIAVTSQSPSSENSDEIKLRDTSGASLSPSSRDHTLLEPTAKSRLLAGDILFVDLFAANRRRAAPSPVCPGVVAALGRLLHRPIAGNRHGGGHRRLDLVGKTVEAHFRDRTGLTVIGLRRGGVAHERGLQNETSSSATRCC
jgi:hypothetical protein